jgi:transcription antitermination factor NusG
MIAANRPLHRLCESPNAMRSHSDLCLGTDNRWFAVQVLPQHEKKVAVLLEYKGYQQFLPLYRARRNWSDRVTIIQQPLFPGYLFCRCLGSQLGPIYGTPGIVRIVGFGRRPYPVSDDEIAALEAIVDSGRNVYACTYLNVGRRVRVQSGPLRGVVGIVSQLRNQNRLVVSVKAMTKSVSIEVDAAELGILP